MDIFFLRSFWGLFYLTFLTGFILIRILKYESSILRELLVSFGLSLLVNYIFTYILGLFKFLFSFPYFIFSFLCFILLLYLVFKEKERIGKNLLIISSSLFMLIFLWILNQFVFRSGSIAWGTDDLFGWHGWALNWYKNKPVFSQINFYPQMLPITWTTSYFFSGTEKIFFFSRSIMPYFFFGIILLAIDEFLQRKNILSLFGTLGLMWLFIIWREFPRLTIGLADIPASFLAFLSFIVLIEVINSKKNDNTLSYGLAILIATASALTKQYGALYFLGFFIIVLIFIIKDYYFNKRELKLKMLLIFFVISFLLISSWYIYNFIYGKYFVSPEKLFSSGPFEFYNLNIISKNKDFIFNLKNSFNILSSYFKSPLIFLLVLIFSILSIFVYPFNIALIMILIPAFLFWSMFVAYDIRNFSIGILFLVYLSGICIGFIFEKIKKKFSFISKTENFFTEIIQKFSFISEQLEKSKIFSFISIFSAILILVLFNFIFTQSKIVKKHNERMKLYVGDYRNVNKMLYEYLEKNRDSIVYTDYYFIVYMPELTYIKDNFTNVSNLITTIKEHRKGVFMILNGRFHSSSVSKECEVFLKTNSIFKEVARCENGYLIEWKN
ncbi:MAG: hypothetical protein ACP5Q5_04800 [Brevinematia bacterium]